MAGPAFVRAGTRAAPGSVETISPAKPTVNGQAGLLLCAVHTANNAVHSTATSGWTKVAQVDSGASFTASLFTAPESAAAPVFTWTGAAQAAAIVAYYGDAGAATDPVVGDSGSTTGTTSPHTSSAITTGRNDSLAVFVDASAFNTALTTPSGWTANNADGGGAGRLTFGSKAVATSGTSSGAISTAGAVAAWVQWQLEIRTALVTSSRRRLMVVG